MSTSLRIRSQAKEIFNRALSASYRGLRVHEPSIWQTKEPEAIEKMRRDPDILRDLNYRDMLVAGRQWTLTPGDETSEMGELAVEVGTFLLKQMKKFTELKLHLGGAYFQGQSFARIHLEPRKMLLGDGLERTWLVPILGEPMDKRMYQQIPVHDERGTLIGTRYQRWHVGTAEWVDEKKGDLGITIEHTYKASPSNLYYGQALLDGLGWCWFAKQHVWSESLQAVEKFAQGLITVKVDGLRDASADDGNQELLEATIAQIEDVRSRHVIAYDSRDEIEVLTGNAEGWQLLDTIEQKIVNKIDRLILGSVLPTGGGGDVGSLARAGVEEDSTESLVQFDREALEETLSDDLVGAVWRANFPNMRELGIWNEVPIFNISHQKKEDPKEVAEVASILHVAGFDLSADDIYERTGNKKPEEGEDVISGAAAQVSEPLGGFGAGVPGFTELRTDPLESEHQDSALNGAQVTAAAELIAGVVNGTMPPATVTRMLVSMFNLSAQEAQAMVADAVAFVPAPTAAPVQEPIEATL